MCEFNSGSIRSCYNSEDADNIKICLHLHDENNRNRNRIFAPLHKVDDHVEVVEGQGPRF